MEIFSSKSLEHEHGDDPEKPWEVSNRERAEILQANKRAAARLSRESKGAK